MHARLLTGFMALRRAIIKYLHLPRPQWLEFARVTDEPDPVTGNFYMTLYFSQPWYVKPTFWSRWGPEALFTRLTGGLVPSADGQYAPQGYKIENLGPVRLEGKGAEEMEKEVQRIRAQRGGCPMAGL